MKTFFLSMIAMLSLAIVACENNDTPGAVAIRPTFDMIEAQAGVTTATVAAYVRPQGDTPVSTVGFSYQEVSGKYIDVVCTSFENGLAQQTLTGLKAQTEYRWYCYAVVGGERFNASLSKTFTTLQEGEVPPVPTPQFGEPTASGVAPTSASLSCAYIYVGEDAVSAAGFSYKVASATDTEYTGVETSVVSPLTYTLSGLASETTYVFYAYVVIDGEQHRSSEGRFTTLKESITPDPVEPQFGTLTTSDVTSSSATLKGSLTYTGEETISEVGFGYKTGGQSDYTNRTVMASVGDKSVSISDLSALTNYTYHLYATIGGKRYQSADASFTTENGTTPPPPVGDVYRTGWAELPVQNQKPGDYYYAYHLIDVNTPTGQKARNFGACYSNDLKCAVWVAAPMHGFYSKKNVNRQDNYKDDPTIPVSQPGKWSGYTRGHMLGSAERLVSRTANNQVMYYSNIVPQLGDGFNTGGGAWNNMESFVDDQWVGYRDTTYQVIGSLWEGNSKVVSGTKIPTHYYKVLLRTKKHQDKWVVNCTRDELQCVGMVLEHKGAQGLKPNRSMMVSVSELERRTGLTFFANVPNAPKDTFEPSEWGL